MTLRNHRKLVVFGGLLVGTSALVVTDKMPAPLFSLYKVLNTGIAGVRMAYIYKQQALTTQTSHQDDLKQKHLRASAILRDTFMRNGGIYVKLGQLIATLDVVVPDQYRDTLRELTRKAKVRPFSTVRKTVEEELGQKLEDVFQKFEELPVSSASIAQVHKAVLRPQYLHNLKFKEVAVKVQHRQLKDGVNSDIFIMKGFVKIAKWIFKDRFKYAWLVEEFEKNLLMELNFKHQAQNAERTAKFLKQRKFKNIRVPQVYHPTYQRILIMEYINGVHVDQLIQMRAQGINSQQMGRNFAKANIEMIHRYGFVHADPHSGNLMVIKNQKNQDQLVILDHGLYQQLSQDLRKSYNRFWLGLVLKDQKMFRKAAEQLGTKKGRLLCSMLTSKGDNQLLMGGKERFKIDPKNRVLVMKRAAELQDDIVTVLNELRRQILLLLKVNEYARTIENQLGGRQAGVYEDIARECVNNLGFSWWERSWIYFKIYWANK